MKSTTPKTVTITRNDLSRALKQPWHSRTCLLAQTAKRNGIIEEDETEYAGKPNPYILERCSDKAHKAMNLFDAYWGDSRSSHRDKALLRRLKAMLPIKVKLS